MQWNAGPEIDAGQTCEWQPAVSANAAVVGTQAPQGMIKRRLRLVQPWSGTETGGEPSNPLPTLPRRAECRSDRT